MKKRVAIVFLIIISIVFIRIFITDETSDITVSMGVNDDIYTMESIIQYGDHLVIGAHYPVFEDRSINKDILDLINRNINKFKDTFYKIGILDSIYKSELNIDYEVHSSQDDIISIKFTIIENMYYYAQPKFRVETINYDHKKDKRIHLNNIFRGDYLEELRSYVSDDSIKFNKDSFSNFILKNDSIVFFLDNDEDILRIPYIMLKEYIRPNFMNFESIETYMAKKPIDIEIITSDEVENNESIKTSTETSRVISLKRPMVALTFDDGPYARATIPILNTLKEHNVVGTFFVLGNRVEMHKDIVKRIVDEGNEIGNHTYSHIQLTSLPKDKVRYQIDKTQKAILSVTGIEPKIMRPTYGSYDDKLKSTINMPMILWSIDPKDWKVKDGEKIANHVLSQVKDGDIILLHDMFESTTEAVDIIVPGLLNRGFQLVTVSELYEYKGEALNAGKIYNHKYSK